MCLRMFKYLKVSVNTAGLWYKNVLLALSRQPLNFESERLVVRSPEEMVIWQPHSTHMVQL